MKSVAACVPILAALAIIAVSVGSAAEGLSSAASSGGGDVDVSDKCDSCRTVVEQFFKGWEKTITGLAADGTFERQPGGAPKITYNQQIEDFLQGFCGSSYMKSFAPYISSGCESLMGENKRAIVGKFLHEEEMMGTVGKRTMRPKRIRDVCGGGGGKGIAGFCAADSIRSPFIKDKKDRCGACRGVVADARFVLRRSWLGSLAPSTLMKKKLELFDLIEPLCNDIFYRHDDEPELRSSVCQEMWDEDDETFIAAMLAEGDTERALCVEKFGMCSGKAEL